MSRRQIVILLAVLLLVFAALMAVRLGPRMTDEPDSIPTVATQSIDPQPAPSYDATLSIDSDRWPNVTNHIVEAIADGYSSICTLERDDAEERREFAIGSYPTAPGMDRDEYPFATCEEGGTGASVELVPSTENRSMGGWYGNEIEQYSDGTQLLVMVIE